MLNVLDLFSGIGGFSLGLERTGGFRTVAFCEIDKRCRSVLRKHWPDVRCFEDVQKLTAADLDDRVDVVCGGFPCQDISVAGKRAGIDGSRSGLWSEYARLIGELRPRYVIVENVSALLIWGLGRVLGDLAALGYDAEWHCIPASAVGAPHRRDRVWIVAFAAGLGRSQGDENGRGGLAGDSSQEGAGPGGSSAVLANAKHEGRLRGNADSGRGDNHDGRFAEAWSDGNFGRLRIDLGAGCDSMAYAFSERGRSRNSEREDATDAGQSPGHPRSRSWDVEPDVGRVANGVPSRVDRLRALGNAVVPQIPEIIGRAILEAEGIFAP